MSKTIYERIYERLEALGIDPAHLPESAKSKAPGVCVQLGSLSRDSEPSS
jgi:hypothetical protein